MRAMGAGALINCCPYFLLSVYDFQDISPPSQCPLPPRPFFSLSIHYVDWCAVARAWWDPICTEARAPLLLCAKRVPPQDRAKGLRSVTAAPAVTFLRTLSATTWDTLGS